MSELAATLRPSDGNGQTLPPLIPEARRSLLDLVNALPRERANAPSPDTAPINAPRPGTDSAGSVRMRQPAPRQQRRHDTRGSEGEFTDQFVARIMDLEKCIDDQNWDDVRSGVDAIWDNVSNAHKTGRISDGAYLVMAERLSDISRQVPGEGTPASRS